MNVITNVFAKLKTAIDLVRQMSEKPCLRTPFDSQHIKGSQTLVKPAREQFYHIYHILSYSERN